MSSLFGLGGGGNVGGGSFYDYSIDQSMRLDGANGLKILDTTNSGDGKTFTISFWHKRSELASGKTLFGAGHGTDGTFSISFTSTDELRVASRYVNTNGANFQIARKTTRVFRDVSSWYHIVIAVDTTVASATSKFDYFTVWVNGEDITSDFTNVTNTEESVAATYNDTTRWNQANNNEQTVGYYEGNGTATAYTRGYFAEVHSVDGQALNATDFGEYSNGVWKPIEVNISDYGTRGFYFDFADSSNIGNDASSGGTEDYTSVNLNAHDVGPDSPTNNFPTMNPLDQEQQGSNENVYIRGNLDVKSQGNSGYGKTRATFAIPTSGKWYWEMRCTNTIGQSMGILNSSADLDNTDQFDGFAEGYSYRNDGKVKNNGTSATYGDSWTNLDNIGVLVDADAGEIFFYKNGTIQNSGTAAFTGLDMSNNYMPIWADRSTSGNGRAIFNFGQDSTFYGSETAGGNSDANGNGDFQYTVPTGALALCSANLPEPAIGPNSATTSDEHFNTVLYTGDGTTSNAITGVGFQPDFTWIKTRNGTASHALFDSVRGADNVLRSNGTDEENATAISTASFGGLTSFDSDGFTVDDGSDGTFDATNGSGDTYVSWNWKAGGTAVSNTDGSITSSVSANQNAGFSIVSYAGNSTTGATIGHGLSSAPDMIIVKNRSDATQSWRVQHSSQGSSNGASLDTTDAFASAVYWNSTDPTSTVFYVDGSAKVNTTGDDYIAYCFHSVDGYSKVGSYTGNSNADGTFVFTGFRPAFLLWKNASAAGTVWIIFDAVRETYNYLDAQIRPNESSAENSAGASYSIDFLSNGFKLRTNDNNFNGGGNEIIYLAFAEAPFKYSLAR